MREYADLVLDRNHKQKLRGLLEEAGLKRKLRRNRFYGDDVQVSYNLRLSFPSHAEGLLVLSPHLSTRILLEAESQESAESIFKTIYKYIQGNTKWLERSGRVSKKFMGMVPEFIPIYE